ncbi:mucin-2 [Osmerus eperlanus]|uniref:mucin-2 n=1 Tax=Osmerus eperlanus TaxID=29151 RepID=UPI002E0F2D53
MEMSAEDRMLKTVGADMEKENIVSLSLHEKCAAVNSIDSLSDLTYLTDDSSDEDWGVPVVKASDLCVSPSPLQCLECNKKFISSKRLIEHSKLHDGEATCNICQVIFSRAISLSIHLQNAHHPSLLSCQTCKLTFSNLWQLNKHIGIHRTTRISPQNQDDNLKNGFDRLEEALLNKPDIVDIVKDHTYSRLIISEDKMKDHSYNRKYPSNGKPDSAALNPAVNGKLKWVREESDVTDWDEEPGCFESKVKTQSTGETDSSITKVTGKPSLTSSPGDSSLTSGTEDCILNCSTSSTSSTGKTETTVTTETASETESCLMKSPSERERGRRRRFCRVSEIVGEGEEEEEEDQDDDNQEEQNEDSSDSDFKPDDISNSDSESSSGSTFGRSSLSSICTQSKRNQSAPGRPSAITDARLNQCVHCKGGPFMDMECLLERCTKMVHFQCTFCIAYFPTQEALMQHSLQSHQKRIPLSEDCGKVLPTNGTMSEHCCLQNQFRQTLVPTVPAQGMPPVLSPAPAKTPPHPLFLTLVQKPALTPAPALPLVQKPALTPAPALPLVHKTALTPAPALPLVQKPALTPAPALTLVQKPALLPAPARPPALPLDPALTLVQKPALPPALPLVPALTPVPTQKVNNVGTPLQSNKCPYCGNGPFFSMEHHMQNCEKRISFQCFLCKALFSTNASIVEHLVKTHNAKVVSAGGSSDTLQNPGNQASTLVCKSAAAVQTSISSSQPSTSSSQPSTKPEPVSAMVSVVHSHPSGGQMTMGKKVLQGSQAKVHPTTTHVATPTKLSSTQVTPPTQTDTTSTPVLHTVGNLIQGILQVRPFVRTNNQAPVLAPASATPLPPSSDPAAKTKKQYSFSAPAIAPATAKPSTPSPAPLKILTVFKNESRELALLKRLKMSWRSKSVHRCRQCGVVSRQPSLIVRHRYLHRGLRPHRCHCGRAFHCQLYLLRHCIQHAEATSYICVTCGETFVGAQVFARHRAGTLRKARVMGGRRRWRPKKKCHVPFSCHCGRTFKRPSSYLWHQLRNRPMAKLA